MRIVAGLDGTAPSMIAHQLLSSTRWPRGSVIRIVTPYTSTAGPRGRAPFDAGVLAADRGVGDTMLWMQEGLAPPLRRAGVSVELDTTPSRGSSVLLDAARKLDADLIVVGDQGIEAAGAATDPPVLELVERASCPVLVARLPRVTRILLAVDGSPGATALPRTVSRWQAFPSAPIDVVSVAPVTTATEFVTPWAPITVDEPEGAVEGCRAAAFEAARELLASGRSAIPSVRSGVPAREILEAAEDYGSDLIMIAACEKSGPGMTRLGSVAHRILMRARGSVLVVGPASLRMAPERRPAEPRGAAIPV